MLKLEKFVPFWKDSGDADGGGAIWKDETRCMGAEGLATPPAPARLIPYVAAVAGFEADDQSV